MTQEIQDKFERELDMVRFYTLAKKYGFCSPYCECGKCRTDVEEFRELADLI